MHRCLYRTGRGGSLGGAGGVDFETLETLQNDPSLGAMTALLLADSGYAPANPPEWIEKLNPQVVLLSVAAGDREGRPSPEMLEVLRGYTLLRTDRDGWIGLNTNESSCGWKWNSSGEGKEYVLWDNNYRSISLPVPYIYDNWQKALFHDRARV